jgi:hypothetical protein
MKEKILKLYNGIAQDSLSASSKCERELCEILTSVIDKKYKIETYADRYIDDYPVKITDISFLGKCNSLPETILCNDNYFTFETSWLDIDWKSYFETLKQGAIKNIESNIEFMEESIVKSKELITLLSGRNFEDLKL